MITDLKQLIDANGFAVLDNALDQQAIAHVCNEINRAGIENPGKQRAGKTFGLRDLMNAVPVTRALANSNTLMSLVEPILGNSARLVRGIYFDKHKDANWKVAWHQDLTIAVQEKIDTEGFRSWSVKAGLTHVQPPAPVLENMLALRVHLDSADELNGGLRVLPGTHRCGRLDPDQIQNLRLKVSAVTCKVRSGGIVAMRPLLLHSSLPSIHPHHRRVLHFEYAAIELPGELKWLEAP